MKHRFMFPFGIPLGQVAITYIDALRREMPLKRVQRIERTSTAEQADTIVAMRIAMVEEDRAMHDVLMLGDRAVLRVSNRDTGAVALSWTVRLIDFTEIFAADEAALGVITRLYRFQSYGVLQ